MRFLVVRLLLTSQVAANLHELQIYSFKSASAVLASDSFSLLY